MGRAWYKTAKLRYHEHHQHHPLEGALPVKIWLLHNFWFTSLSLRAATAHQQNSKTEKQECSANVCKLLVQCINRYSRDNKCTIFHARLSPLLFLSRNAEFGTRDHPLDPPSKLIFVSKALDICNCGFMQWCSSTSIYIVWYTCLQNSKRITAVRLVGGQLGHMTGF